MKRLIWLLMFLAFSANASEMMDKVVSCNRIASGAFLRVQGFGHDVKWVSPDRMAELNNMVPGTLPKDAMYVRDDGETPAQKAAYDADLQKGWTMEDRYIATHAGEPKHPKEILEACMHEQDAMNGAGPGASEDDEISYEKPLPPGRPLPAFGESGFVIPGDLSGYAQGRFYQTASSQGLADTGMSKDRMCEFRGEILVRSVRFKGAFDSVGAMLAQIPFPEAWSDEFKAVAKEDIETFYAYTGNDSSNYIMHFVNRCKAHSEL